MKNACWCTFLMKKMRKIISWKVKALLKNSALSGVNVLFLASNNLKSVNLKQRLYHPITVFTRTIKYYSGFMYLRWCFIELDRVIEQSSSSFMDRLHFIPHVLERLTHGLLHLSFVFTLHLCPIISRHIRWGWWCGWWQVSLWWFFAQENSHLRFFLLWFISREISGNNYPKNIITITVQEKEVFVTYTEFIECVFMFSLESQCLLEIVADFKGIRSCWYQLHSHPFCCLEDKK